MRERSHTSNIPHTRTLRCTPRFKLRLRLERGGAEGGGGRCRYEMLYKQNIYDPIRIQYKVHTTYFLLNKLFVCACHQTILLSQYAYLKVVRMSCRVVITTVKGYPIYCLFVLCNLCILNVTRYRS
jgi:hypothetical protein